MAAENIIERVLRGPERHRPGGGVELIPIDQLRVDTTYQREPDAKHVERIAGNWDPNQVGVLMANRRAHGGLYVIDGSHRLEAAKIQGVKALQVEVLNLPAEVEPGLYVALNRSRKRVAPVDEHKAAVAAGVEREKLIDHVLMSFDLRVAKTSGPRNFRALTAAQRLVDIGGADLLYASVAVAETAWPHDPARLERKLIIGLGIFFITYPELMPDPASVAARLADKTTPSELVDSATAQGGGVWSERTMAAAITQVYNRRLKKPLDESALSARAYQENRGKYRAKRGNPGSDVYTGVVYAPRKVTA